MNCKVVFNTFPAHFYPTHRCLSRFRRSKLALSACKNKFIPLLAALTLLFSAASASGSQAEASSDLSNMERCQQFAEQSSFGQDYDRSILSYCNRAIRFDQLSRADRGRTYINRGVLLKNMLQINYAAGDFRRARQHLRKAPEVDVNIGNIAYLKGQFDQALRSYSQALSKNIRQRHVAYLNRGLTQERLGDIDAARQDYQRALQSNPAVQNAHERLIDLSVNVALGESQQKVLATLYY